MTTEIRKLYASYDMVGKLIDAIKEGKAELIVRTKDAWGSEIIESEYKLDEIFDCPDYLHRIKGDLLMYHADLRTQLIDALVADGEHAMGLDDLPSDPPELRIFPKDDYRRSYSNNQEDDGR